MSKVKGLLSQEEMNVLLDNRGDNYSAQAHEMFVEGEFITALTALLTDVGFDNYVEFQYYVTTQAKEQWSLWAEKTLDSELPFEPQEVYSDE